MPFDKESAKEAGKKSSRKGTENKSNKDLRAAFKGFIDDNTDELKSLLDRVKIEDPGKALMIIHKFSEFFLPRQKSIEIKETTSVEYLLSLTPDEQKRKIIEIQKKINDEL